jgi:hypothetical protein
MICDGNEQRVAKVPVKTGGLRFRLQDRLERADSEESDG